MNIIRLESNNVKRLRAIQITPEGNMVVIGGNNGEGKSSVLDSILYAIGGTSTHCPQPVRHGENKAQIVCSLDNGLVIRRTFTAAGGTALTVTDSEGRRYTSPQTILDAMVGKLSFDPLEFSRMPEKKQLETLKDLVGIDCDAMDAERKAIYDERTMVNRDAKNAQAGADAMPHYPDAPVQEVSASGLMEELKRRQAVNADIEKRRSAHEELTGRIVKGKAHVDNLAAQIADLHAQLSKSKAALEELERREAEDAPAVAALAPEYESSVLAQLDDIQTINGKVAANARRREMADKAQQLQEKAAKLTEKMEQIDAKKTEMLGAAKFPVPGMSFDENGVLLNGIPFSQASDAEKIRMSVAMGLAMNPKLRVMLIRDGSLLDTKSMALISGLAVENDAQIWIERVGAGDECSVVIEDGQIKP
jgi:DNA repair exonuclease SbcCD ATPase subunit